jgi:hypothetical protein
MPKRLKQEVDSYTELAFGFSLFALSRVSFYLLPFYFFLFFCHTLIFLVSYRGKGKTKQPIIIL